MNVPGLSARIAGAVGDFPEAAWDALDESGNPFVCHAFLTAMEDSGSIGEGTGWASAPIVIESAGGELLGALPAWLKSHSQGEYVFDHAWADAWGPPGRA